MRKNLSVRERVKALFIRNYLENDIMASDTENHILKYLDLRNGKIVFNPTRRSSLRDEILLFLGNDEYISIESNSMIHVVLDYLSEDTINFFKVKEIKNLLDFDGRFYYYKNCSQSQLSHLVGTTLRYLNRVLPNKVLKTKNGSSNFFEILEPFEKRIEYTIIYF